MYTFFTVFGVFFVIISSILINYIYNIFSINKVTSFLNPIDGRSILDEISLTILPIIVWSFIEIPVLGDNNNFLIAIILNIIVNCSIIYIMKYGIFVFFNQENNLITIISISIATILGYFVAFMVLKSHFLINLGHFSYFVSIIGMIILLTLHSLYILKKPSIKKEKTKYEEKR